MKKLLVFSCQLLASAQRCRSRLSTINYQLATTSGFTLIETLVAISLLSIAIVAPMSLTSQSLSAAYYARDQITAFNLAQEGLEAVRAVRDGQILLISKTASTNATLFGLIPVDKDFVIDSHIYDPSAAMHACSGACPTLQTDTELYGYRPSCSWPTSDCGNGEGWSDTNFTRTMHACYIQSNGTCAAQPVTDEIRLTATVSWPTTSRQTRTFSIYENLYRWVSDGAASSST